MWTDGHRSPDIGGKPLEQRTGPKHKVRKKDKNQIKEHAKKKQLLGFKNITRCKVNRRVKWQRLGNLPEYRPKDIEDTKVGIWEN